MINTSTYRGYEILVDTQNGGWTIKLGSVVLASRPTQGSARHFIDAQIARPKDDLIGDKQDGT